MSDRARYTHRRPRYYDGEESDSSDVDNYPPPRPRQRDDRRAPPPPAPAPAPQQVRRPSILVDPDETASQRERRRPRSNSNVRLQTSDDDGNDPRAPRSRRGPSQRDPRHDLEAKDTEDHRRFRAKRDGYTSDEGENLRQAKRAPPPPRGYPDDDDEYGRQRPPERSLPLRGKPRDPVDGVEYGDAAVPADGKITRRRTYKEPSARDRQGYDDYDAPSPRRQDRRRTTDFDDPGYRSDHARRGGPPRRERPRRDYDDRDDYDRPRRRPDDRGYQSGGDRPQRPRPQDYYSDYREDRAPRRGDPRRPPRDDRYDDRRRDDDRARGSGSRKQTSRGGGGMKDWQKEASAAFMTYAMPMIKKEGTRYVKKELQKFLANRGGGSV